MTFLILIKNGQTVLFKRIVSYPKKRQGEEDVVLIKVNILTIKWLQKYFFRSKYLKNNLRKEHDYHHLDSKESTQFWSTDRNSPTVDHPLLLLIYHLQTSSMGHLCFLLH